ncbi:MAG: hypothetical protein CMJ20_12050 [Phycisphaeraceae bacterium]|nr:hypothetical protein [Phycisphaeraceae bacterium]
MSDTAIIARIVHNSIDFIGDLQDEAGHHFTPPSWLPLFGSVPPNRKSVCFGIYSRLEAPATLWL